MSVKRVRGEAILSHSQINTLFKLDEFTIAGSTTSSNSVCCNQCSQGPAHALRTCILQMCKPSAGFPLQYDHDMTWIMQGGISVDTSLLTLVLSLLKTSLGFSLSCMTCLTLTKIYSAVTCLQILVQWFNLHDTVESANVLTALSINRFVILHSGLCRSSAIKGIMSFSFD